ncbi:exosortase H-associated membrane protein [Ottowia thiooxydans]|uniref:exosortase H-associated membrane protein n=1 Tax=Ottowia thiooxydans TaxID=219182 RepID=UPI000415AFD5|nr:exosortase H-associated membrane protein [Ottowia thiooxydans]
MRATLIGRFLLLAIIGLMVLLPLWYWAAPWLAAAPIWLAGTVMTNLFPWADSFEQKGVMGVLHTLVQVRMKGPQGDVLGELTPEASYPTYGYGLVLLWAMLIASRPRRWWLKGLFGSLLLVPAQAFCLCFQWLRDVVIYSGASGAAYLKYPGWANEVVVYGYQFGFLMLTPVAPILLWLMFDKQFVAALWLEAALSDKPKPARERARMD